jgi:enoyl-CoA hydratase/carnithine racemase
MPTLLCSSDNGIAILTLNRPAKRNALSLEVLEELFDELGELQGNSDIRCVILAAEGPVFCSGHDLDELVACSKADYRRIFNACTTVMTRLRSLPQPVIAEVQGMATAAGCQLAASCDLVVAAENAAFATPGVRIGLFCSTPMIPLVRAIGRKRAMEMLLTGDPISAATAHEWGLVNRVVPAGQLRSASYDLARKIAAASQRTIAIGKRAFYRQLDESEDLAYQYTTETMICNALDADAQEGISAFLSRRQPVWNRR